MKSLHTSTSVETVGIEPTTCIRRSRQVPVPLRNREGVVIAYAVLDAADKQLTEHHWYLDTDDRPGGKMGDGEWSICEGGMVDHINGLTLDDRRANLRVVTNALARDLA